MHPKSPDERETLYGLFCLFSLIGDELGQRLAAEHSRARKSCQAKISIIHACGHPATSLRLWMPAPPLVPRYLWQVAGKLLYHNPRTPALSPADPLGHASRQRNVRVRAGPAAFSAFAIIWTKYTIIWTKYN